MPSHRQQPIIITGAVLAILIQPIAWSKVPLDRTSNRLSIKLHFNSKALTDPPTLGTDIQYTRPNAAKPTKLNCRTLNFGLGIVKITNNRDC